MFWKTTFWEKDEKEQLRDLERQALVEKHVANYCTFEPQEVDNLDSSFFDFSATENESEAPQKNARSTFTLIILSLVYFAFVMHYSNKITNQ